MSGGLEVFLISSYYSRRRATASGLRIIPTGVTKQHNMHLSPDAPVECFWNLRSRVQSLNSPDYVVYKRSVMAYDVNPLSYVLKGSYSAGVYHYTAEVWKLHQTTRQPLAIVATKSTESTVGFRFLGPDSECPIREYLRFKNSRVLGSEQTAFLNACQWSFRLEAKDDLIFFEDCRGKGINTCRMLSHKRLGNYGFHLTETKEDMYKQLVAGRFYMLKGTEFARIPQKCMWEGFTNYITDFHSILRRLPELRDCDVERQRHRLTAGVRLLKEFLVPCCIEVVSPSDESKLAHFQLIKDLEFDPTGPFDMTQISALREAVKSLSDTLSLLKKSDSVPKLWDKALAALDITDYLHRVRQMQDREPNKQAGLWWRFNQINYNFAVIKCVLKVLGYPEDQPPFAHKARILRSGEIRVENSLGDSNVHNTLIGQYLEYQILIENQRLSLYKDKQLFRQVFIEHSESSAWLWRSFVITSSEYHVVGGNYIDLDQLIANPETKFQRLPTAIYGSMQNIFQFQDGLVVYNVRNKGPQILRNTAIGVYRMTKTWCVTNHTLEMSIHQLVRNSPGSAQIDWNATIHHLNFQKRAAVVSKNILCRFSVRLGQQYTYLVCGFLKDGTKALVPTGAIITSSPSNASEIVCALRGVKIDKQAIFLEYAVYPIRLRLFSVKNRKLLLVQTLENTSPSMRSLYSSEWASNVAGGFLMRRTKRTFWLGILNSKVTSSPDLWGIKMKLFKLNY